MATPFLPRVAGRVATPTVVWTVWCLAGLLACALESQLVIGSTAETILYFGTSGIALAAMTVAVIRMPRPARWVWLPFLLGVALYVAADVVYNVLQFVLDEMPFPGWADPLYLSSYVALLGGLAVLIRRRTPDRDREAWLDAAIISLAACAIVGSFLVVPMLTASDQSPLASATAVAYPVLDVLVLSGLVRVMVSGGRWNTGLGLLVVATFVMLAADLAYNALALAGAVEDTPPWVEAMYLAYTVLMAAGATAPDAGHVADRVAERSGALTRGRVAGLTLGALTVPVALALQTWSSVDTSSRLLAVASVTVIVLVLWRVLLLFQTVQRQARQLADMARLDPLTSLANRRTWDVGLRETEALARRSGTSVCVAMLDLDHFKAYNDLHGHPRGDTLLIACADAWRCSIDGDGLLARYGGEEFSLLLTGATMPQAQARLERLRAATPAGITVSVGIAAWDGIEDLATTVDRADRALYAAKALGRDRVVVHDGDRAVPMDRSGRVQPLSRQVVGVFQPVVDLATRSVCSYDARARLPRLRPRESREAARRAGFGPAFEAAALALTLDGHREGMPVKVALSAAGVLESDVLGSLPTDLSSVRMVVRPDDLTDAADVAPVLNRLRERGAELLYLHDDERPPDVAALEALDLDLVGLDASVLRAGAGTAPTVRAVIELAASRAVPIIGEDVRTEDELEALLDLGVTTATGRLFDDALAALPATATRPRRRAGDTPAVPGTRPARRHDDVPAGDAVADRAGLRAPDPLPPDVVPV